MPLDPRLFARLWQQSQQLTPEQREDADDDDIRRVRESIASSRRANLYRLFRENGLDLAYLNNPTQAMQDEMNTALGGHALEKPYGLLDNSQPQQGEVAGVVNGQEVWINNQTQSTRPRGLIDQGTGKPFVPPSDATAAGRAAGAVTPGTGGSPATGGAATTGGTGAPGEQLPSDVGITFGQYKDFKAQITQALNQLGFADLAEQYRTMNPMTDGAKIQEIVHFVDAKVDMGGILNFYKNRADLVAINPGLPYDMSKEEYGRATEEIGGFGARAGGAPSDAATKESLREKMSTSETEAGLADLQRREGRTAQTAEDIKQFRTRPKEKLEEATSGTGATVGATGPVSSRLGKDAPVGAFGRRR